MHETKILGCGWAKTGTTTLGECLKTLGYQHHSTDLKLAQNLPNHAAIMEAATAQSFEDWPWLLLFREFDAAFPECRFVLTVREPDAWLTSYKRHLSDQGRAYPAMNALRERLYGLKFPNPSDEALLERYARHNREVQDYFADRPGKLLTVDWTKGDGWGELCGFLGKPVPSVPFPRANAAGSRKPLTIIQRARRFVGSYARQVLPKHHPGNGR